MQHSFVRFPRATLTALAVLFGAATPALAAEQKTVAVTAIVEHPALDAARDGVKDELKAAGFESGKGFKFEYQSAQGNSGTAAQIARKYVGDKPDAIVAIATPSAQAVVAATKDVPVVFSAVTDPVAAKLIEWLVLRAENDDFDFQRYAGFATENPGWPNINQFRRKAEAALFQNGVNDAVIRTMTAIKRARLPP